MFAINLNESGDVVLAGRFDASQVDKAESVLGTLQTTTSVDFSGLDYISSAGIGCLLKTQKRLGASGHMLILVRMNKLVRDIFNMARLEVIFRIEDNG